VSRTAAPELDRLQTALDEGDLGAARRALLTATPRERELLAQELGPQAFERARRAAARGGRSAKLGKVIVLPGIMGSELDVVDRSGDTDRIWLNFARLLGGRIADLGIAEGGGSAKPGLQVKTAGVHQRTYLPLLLELDTRWHVRPFPFDWRDDLDKAAALLDREVKNFGGGAPVHLVAHSMGGLVSRRFVQRHHDTWRSLDDPSGQGRGGRLVMLGTPNRGSLTVPLVLTGAEKLVRILEAADMKHDMQELLAIVGSFPGLYQMLPSRHVDVDDDHAKLFDAKAWGGKPVRKALLAKGRAFIEDLDEVVDPERLVYVAGANQSTPLKIRVDGPGRFSYQETLDGDGRVTHRHGLLEGVATYFVEDDHGSLPRNDHVLDAITELLRHGRTAALATTRPKRSARGAGRRAWVSGEALAPVPTEAEAIVRRARGRRRSGKLALTSEESVRLETLAAEDYLGSGGEAPGEEDEVGEPGAQEPPAGPPATISLEVVWGDVTEVEGDVYAVGHYEGVLPLNAELALDKLVSGIDPSAQEFDRRLLVITQHTRRGILRGALGDVSFFPASGERHAGELVAVAGMGHPGTFDVSGLRRVVGGLILAVAALPSARTLCTVLIGSGEGTMAVPDAVRGLVEGIAEAADEMAARPDVFLVPVERIVVVERDRERAHEIREALKPALKARAERAPLDSAELALVGKLGVARGRRVSVEDGLALLADSALEAATPSSGAQRKRTLAGLAERIDANANVRSLALEALRAEAIRELPASRLPRFRVERRKARPRAADTPVRVSFWDDGKTIRVAAINRSATVPERLIGVGRDVVDDLVAKMTDPPADEVAELSDLLYRLLLPAEFRQALGSGPLVIEVDRRMARVHWEMLASEVRADGSAKPLAVRTRFARQLRTVYSPPPMPPRRRAERFHALVVGDPGNPEQGEDLPGARSEALRVKELLEERGESTSRRGSARPPSRGKGRCAASRPRTASRCSPSCSGETSTSSTTRGTGTSTRSSRIASAGSSNGAS